MSEKTAIGWTDHTFNVAWGCTKIAAGCASCYAERDSKRYGFDVWGRDKPRRTFGEKHWNEPLKWNRMAALEGRRHKVFTSSMADVFEDHPTIIAETEKLWPLIRATPWLDWQILTKRADRMRLLAPRDPLPNAWMGVSVAEQRDADANIPALLQTPAALRWVSYEPAVGPIDFMYPATLWPDGAPRCCSGPSEECGCNGFPTEPPLMQSMDGARVNWMVIGGESGSRPRPFEIPWLAAAMRDCREMHVAVFVKQDSGRLPGQQGRIPDAMWVHEFPTPRS